MIELLFKGCPKRKRKGAFKGKFLEKLQEKERFSLPP